MASIQRLVFTALSLVLLGTAGRANGFDLAIDAVVMPTNSPAAPLGFAPVTIVLRNDGLFIPAGTCVPLQYRVDCGAPVTETLIIGIPLPPGATITYTFSAFADLTVSGFPCISVRHFLIGDRDPCDDVCGAVVHNGPAVWPYPAGGSPLLLESEIDALGNLGMPKKAIKGGQLLTITVTAAAASPLIGSTPMLLLDFYPDCTPPLSCFTYFNVWIACGAAPVAVGPLTPSTGVSVVMPPCLALAPFTMRFQAFGQAPGAFGSTVAHVIDIVQ